MDTSDSGACGYANTYEYMEYEDIYVKAIQSYGTYKYNGNMRVTWRIHGGTRGDSWNSVERSVIVERSRTMCQ